MKRSRQQPATSNPALAGFPMYALCGCGCMCLQGFTAWQTWFISLPLKIWLQFLSKNRILLFFFPLGVAFYMMLLPMPDNNILPCNCGMKWSRKCEDKRKNCFDLGAFVNDSPIGSRLDWFSSFTALHVSRYGEMVTGSLNVWVAIIWQDNIPEIPLAFMIIKEAVKKRNCPTLVIWIYLFHNFLKADMRQSIAKLDF